MYSLKQTFVFSNQSLLLSKYNVICYRLLPKFLRSHLYFFVCITSYQKSLLLFYIFLMLTFGSLQVRKKKITRNFIVFCILIKYRNILRFYSFLIQSYLPLLDVRDNVLKFCNYFCTNSVFHCFIITYNTCMVPTIFSVLCSFNEEFFTMLTAYKFQIQIFILIDQSIKDSGSILLRLNRFPVCVRYLNIA